MKYINSILIIFCAFLLLSVDSVAQEAVTLRPSPLAMVKAKYQDAYIRIVYSQPHKRGRKVFGKLVPYAEIWRTGANDATEITITKDIVLAGQHTLPAGTYSIYTIPNPDQWTIIFNSDVGVWGAYNYNEKKDVLRFDVPVNNNTKEVYEPFTILLDQKKDEATMEFRWDNVRVAVPIHF